MEKMKEHIAFEFTEGGEYEPREGLPFKRRKNIAAIIIYGDELLVLSWNQTNYNNSLVTGGIDDGEEPERAVEREVIEETGYYDIKSIEPVACVNISRFFVEHKNENREAIYHPFIVKLNSLSRKDIDDYEKKEHTCIWVKKDKLEEITLFENHKMMLERALQENKTLH